MEKRSVVTGDDMKFPKILAGLLIVIVLVSGCGKGKDAADDAIADTPQNTGVTDTTVPAPEPEPETEPEPEPPYRTMLTGLPAETENNDRAVLVIVENQKLARPQSGLHKADIVYEILAEGDITRFAVIYQSEIPDLIGPVRSIRPYFIELGKQLDSLIIHAGWSPEAQKILTGGSYAYINEVAGGDHVYFWRSTDRKAPHNVYTSAEKIRQGWKDKKYRTEWKGVELTFLDDPGDVQGDPAAKVTLDYIGSYSVRYEYNAEKGVYLRYMEDEPHKDRETEEQLAAANILIAEASHRILDNVGRRAVDVLGPGHGWLVQAGKVREITWRMEGGLVRAFIDGEEQKLVPGKTWINIIPIGSGVHFE
jgi:hypothetical protein